MLSLKAGGTGLNLTAASHVIHFDRWWNPAVEAQAVDGGVDGLAVAAEEGRELVEYCAAELEAVGRGLEELKLEELVARLEAGTREEAG